MYNRILWRRFLSGMALEEAEGQGFLTCQNAKTASIRIADTAGTNVPTTYGENVNPHSQK
jgi:hypothetical protein